METAITGDGGGLNGLKAAFAVIASVRGAWKAFVGRSLHMLRIFFWTYSAF
ncbi:hypothetical protein [Luteimonas fraxinea]|uniref:hypothetical protein n=1 Tax=Luteimonas fraxinea TaxID=2901869 RepID=UPI001E59407B|nr:hypothetical protein [Luteimonas fraxinea]MCD9125414.1 hypothetical protein [Luteimonas fraxinea]